jgi:hypothetical protein
MSLFATAPRLPTRPPTHWEKGETSLEVQRSGVNLTHKSSAEDKDEWNYTSIPPYVFMAFHVIKQKDSLYIKEATVVGECW